MLAVVLMVGCAKNAANSDKAKEIQINDSGVGVTGGTPVVVSEGVAYQNQSLPQDFSLSMPVLATGGIIDTYQNIAGSCNRDRIVFRGTTTTDYVFQAQRCASPSRWFTAMRLPRRRTIICSSSARHPVWG